MDINSGISSSSTRCIGSVKKRYKPVVLSSTDSDSDEPFSEVNKRLFKPFKETKHRVASEKRFSSSTDGYESSDSSEIGRKEKKGIRPLNSSSDPSDNEPETMDSPIFKRSISTPELLSGNVSKLRCAECILPQNCEQPSSLDVVKTDLSSLKRTNDNKGGISTNRKIKTKRENETVKLKEFDLNCFSEDSSMEILNKLDSLQITLSSNDQIGKITHSKPMLQGTASEKKIGKVTSYTFSGRKTKPVLISDDDSDEVFKTTILKKIDAIVKPSKKVGKVNREFLSNKNVQPITFSSVENDKQIISSKSTEKLSFLKSLSPTASDDKANRQALEFKRNFNGNKTQLTQFLYRLYNEEIFDNKLPFDMPVEWNNSLKQTAGYFRSVKNDGKYLYCITLSTHVLTSADKVRDTLLHEMCHAAVRIISKVREKHGPVWKTWAVRCAVVFPELKIPQRCHRYDIQCKYNYKCVSCGKKYGRQRYLDVSRHRCKCHGSLQPIF